tara:strand:- start:107 stop:310 length:204 start_codon:yes stop_codon:yes gene_type:complete
MFSFRGRPEFLLITLLIASFVAIYIAIQDEPSSLSLCTHQCSVEKTKKENLACMRGCLRYARIDGKL